MRKQQHWKQGCCCLQARSLKASAQETPGELAAATVAIVKGTCAAREVKVRPCGRVCKLPFDAQSPAGGEIPICM